MNTSSNRKRDLVALRTSLIVPLVSLCMLTAGCAAKFGAAVSPTSISANAGWVAQTGLTPEMINALGPQPKDCPKPTEQQKEED